MGSAQTLRSVLAVMGVKFAQLNMDFTMMISYGGPMDIGLSNGVKSQNFVISTSQKIILRMANTIRLVTMPNAGVDKIGSPLKCLKKTHSTNLFLKTKECRIDRKQMMIIHELEIEFG